MDLVDQLVLTVVLTKCAKDAWKAIRSREADVPVMMTQMIHRTHLILNPKLKLRRLIVRSTFARHVGARIIVLSVSLDT